jgi:hypothetical protein
VQSTLWRHGDPDAVARTILGERDFRTLAAGKYVAPPEPFWEVLRKQAWQWLLDHVLKPLFGPLLHGIGHALGASKGAGTVFGFVLIGLALAGLAFVLVRLILAFLPRIGARGAPLGDVTALGEIRSQDQWLVLARDAAARGDYRHAIGALFAAALALLDDRAVIGFDAARTPGEYRRLVRRARDEASGPFDTLADRFVRATYAEAAPARADFDVAERALADLDPLVRA